MATEPKEKLQDLVGDFRDAMLVTRDGGGTMQGRPMHVADHDEGSGTLTFVTSVRTEKVDEIREASDACVTFQSGSVYVSLSGECSISRDRERIRELWGKGMELWFPDGPEQEDVALILFRPSLGEYWDQSGTEGLNYLWKAATAFARDESPDVGGDKDLHAETTL